MKRAESKNLFIGKNTRIAPTVIFLLPEREQKDSTIIIGDNVTIRDGTIIYGGVVIGSNVTIDHYCIIREGSIIGNGTRIRNYTEINRDVNIGYGCRIGGVLANRATVGNDTTSLGYIVHNYPVHGGGYHEEAPRIKDNVIAGRLSIIIGDIDIPAYSRIKAGQLVTEKNIEEVVGVLKDKRNSNK